MIRADTLFDFDKIDNLSAFSAAFPGLVNRGAQFAFSRQIRLPLLQALRHTPKRRYWTGADFANDASRRAFFAKTGGKAYQRTGKLAAGWRADITVNDNAIAISAENKVPYEKWVSGRYQVAGHTKTGWPLHADVFSIWRPRAAGAIGIAVTELVQKEFQS